MDENTVKKLLGQRIRFYRKSLLLSQFALGEKIDMDQRQIAHIEGGKCFPSLRTLIKFSNAFECTIKDLFDFIEIPNDKILKNKLTEKINKYSTKELNLLYKIIFAIEEGSIK